MRYPNIPEEELKNKTAQDYFADFDCTKIVGKVDFCVLPKKIPGQAELFSEQSLLWAEAKANRHDVVAMFAQLILTIGRARTFNQHFPPAFLGAFDAEKIAFVPYEKVLHLFYKTDFNWNVAPSDHQTKEFSEIRSLIDGVLETEKHLYHFGKDDRELRFFIKHSLAKATPHQKIHIDKNNFLPIYLRWLDEVKPLIDFDFAKGREQDILDSDFYLADLFVDDRDTDSIDDDVPVKEDMFVVFRDQKYEITKENLRTLFDATVKLKDKTRYRNFWKRYKRPPIGGFQDYIIKRRDLLVPQDVRERKGAFFTPRQWVELSQRYIADVLGRDWQDQYYLWDCCAGTGNLLAGLANKYNIYASTLDQADVNAMHDRINNGANLLKSHVFQFDFLNDEFDKLPEGLQKIINDPEKRKKLVIYINPPYAEAGNRRTFSGTGANKTNVAVNTRVYEKYKSAMGIAGRELFAQFMIRIYREIPHCALANFSTLKNLQGPNFSRFREKFQAKLKKIFLMPANTFDNVTGSFPIGFFVWDTSKQEEFRETTADVHDEKALFTGYKKLFYDPSQKSINDWMITTRNRSGERHIGFMSSKGGDFQNTNSVFIINEKKQLPHPRGTQATDKNLTEIAVYFAVRHAIKPNWLNDHDQFLYPNDSWEKDFGFQNDCLVFTLFHGKNSISAKDGTNHWIPFTEQEVNARDRFDSRFMSDFIAGKIKKTNGNGNIFEPPKVDNGTKRRFSPDAQDVFDAGRALWRYYHRQKEADPNASLYDIREHFQGRSDKGKMNSKSPDEKYSELIGALREKLSHLADKIAAKVYEHGFLLS